MWHTAVWHQTVSCRQNYCYWERYAVFQGLSYSLKFCGKCSFPNLFNNGTSQFVSQIMKKVAKCKNKQWNQNLTVRKARKTNIKTVGLKENES